MRLILLYNNRITRKEKVMNVREKFNALPADVRKALINKHVRYIPPFEEVYNRCGGWYIWREDTGELCGPGVPGGVLTGLAFYIFKHKVIKLV
jgi:hypothetical protein